MSAWISYAAWNLSNDPALSTQDVVNFIKNIAIAAVLYLFYNLVMLSRKYE